MIVKPTDALGSVKFYNEKGINARRPEGVEYKNSRLQPDEVILSNQSSELSSTIKQIRELSDVRQDKVDDLKERVESGTYYVNAYDIASKIVSAYKGGI